MYAAANNPEVSKTTGVSQKVANEFIQATPPARFQKLRERITKKKAY